LRLDPRAQRRHPSRPRGAGLGQGGARVLDALRPRGDRGAVRAAALAALALALSAAPAAAQTCGDTAGVPAFTPGAVPITDEQVSAYLSQVDAASTRVETGVAGVSVQGRPLPYAIASSPHNLARLGAIAARARAPRRGP